MSSLSKKIELSPNVTELIEEYNKEHCHRCSLLQFALEKAILNEDYERAAVIRDEIIKRDAKNSKRK